MRGVGAAVAACLAAGALTGCGGGQSGGAAAESGASGGPAAAADEVTVTPAAVRGDLRAAAAAGGFGRPRFVDNEAVERMGPCYVLAQVRTTAKPDRKAVAEVVAALKARGWGEVARTSESAGDGWGLEKAGWTLSVLAGAMSKEQILAARPDAGPEEGVEAFSGLYLDGFALDCGSASTTPAP